MVTFYCSIYKLKTISAAHTYLVQHNKENYRKVRARMILIYEGRK